MLPSLRPWALSHVLNLATKCVKTFGSFGLPGSFFSRHYYLLAYLNHLEILHVSSGVARVWAARGGPGVWRPRSP